MEQTPVQFGIAKSDSLPIVQFLDEAIRPGVSFSVRDEFPSVFGDYPGGQSLFAEHSGKVIAHVAILPRVFRHPLFHFKVGLIGSVVTTPEFRGHGIASALLRESLVQLKNAGCLFAVLWAESPAIYKALGFERTGTEQSLRFSSSEIVDEDLTEAVYAFDSRKHVEGLWRLYRQHKVSIDRSLQEMKRLCRIPESKIFVTLSGETVTSYIVVNKGLDFPNYIHEWGGRLETVRANIARVQRQYFPQTDLTLIAPGSYDLSLLRRMTKEHHVGVVGMMKLLDRQRLRAVYLDYLKASNERNWMDETWGGDGRSPSHRTDAEFMKAVLGDATTTATPKLPFFLWGLDSI
jgi:GNAT superfamily N-acetyltransferase